VTDSRKRVLIIGYGEMGHAMEYLLRPSHTLHIWDRHPVQGREPVDLEATAADADFIIYCVPASPIGELAERILPTLAGHSLSLSVAKGLDARGRSAARIFEDVYADRFDYGLLYGPMISEELRAGRPGFAQLGMRTPALYRKATSLFSGSGLYLEYTSDICGISWAAVLKNVYAILFGAADELGLGDNMRGFLAVASMHEMDAIITRLGGSALTSHHLAGLGDLITTATSAGSHHHALGGMLVRGERDQISGEGVHTLTMVRDYGLIDENDYPLFRLVHRIVDDPVNIRDRLGDYLGNLGEQDDTTG
jgi:glycerol-3-phosphate dehydrogenase (NAD(P)+)